MKALVVAACLLVASPASAQSIDDWVHLAMGTYITLSFADVAQTAYCYGASAVCREQNPVLGPVVRHFGVVPALTFKGAAHAGLVYVLLKHHKKSPRTVFWSTLAIIAIQAYTVEHNRRQLQRIH